MDKPTCKTCPYFDCLSAMGGYCNRMSPRPEIRSDADDIFLAWPPVTEDDWCGQHPDFPAYIASLKPPEPQTRPCEHCHGDGLLHAGNSLLDGKGTCPPCDGKGRVSC